MRKGPAAAAAALVIAFTAAAHAQPAEPAQPEQAEAGDVIVVLGLGANEALADDAAAMTAALRDAAATVPTWRVHREAATLESAMQTHSCETPDQACMERIAEALAASRIAYGRVAAEASGTMVTLAMHTRGSTELGGPAREPLAIGADADYQAVAEALWARVAGDAYQPAPEAIAPPEEETPPPAEPEDDAFDAFEMEEETPPLVATVAPIPQPAEADRTPWDDDRVPIGIGLAVAGGILVGSALYVGLRLSELNDDPQFTSFRSRVPSGLDVCDQLDQDVEWGASAAEARRARTVCSEGKALEVLGIVFMGAGIVAAGVGAALLISASASEDHVAVGASGTF